VRLRLGCEDRWLHCTTMNVICESAESGLDSGGTGSSTTANRKDLYARLLSRQLLSVLQASSKL
jgi:hypothetical protein